MFSFFICCCRHHERITNCLYVYISYIRQIVVYRFLGVSILQLLIVYHIYDLRTMICWRCHSNSLNTGSRLPYLSDVKTRKRRNVVGIDMIRNNRITIVRSPYMPEQLWYKNRISRRIRNHSWGLWSRRPYTNGSLSYVRLTTNSDPTTLCSF